VKPINGNSVGVLLEYGKARILSCGDMNEKAEKLFLEHCKTETPMLRFLRQVIMEASISAPNSSKSSNLG